MVMVNADTQIKLPNGQWIAAGLAGQVVAGKVNVNNDTVIRLPGGGTMVAGAIGLASTPSGGPTYTSQPVGQPTPVDEPAAAKPVAPPRDFASEARLLFPWVPDALRQVFVDAWAKYGDPNVALGTLRQDARYDQFFPGNRRADGTTALTEAEYLSTVEGYDRALRSFQLDPADFRVRYGELIQGGSSPDEFLTDLGQVQQEVFLQAPAIRAKYAEFGYSADVSDRAILASRLSPGVSAQVFEQRFRSAQIGGAAANYGFAYSSGQAERLAQAGVGQDQANQLFAQAASEIPTLNDLMARHNDPEDTLTLDEYTNAIVLRDPAHLQAIARVLTGEKSLFSSQDLLAQDQSGGVLGLKQR